MDDDIGGIIGHMIIQQAKDDLRRTIKQVKDDLRRTIVSEVESLWYPYVTISYMFAVAIDPLFLYIPIIDQNNKCLGMDKTLWTVSLIVRSLSDFIALVLLLYRLHVLFKEVGGNRPHAFKYLGITVSAVFTTSVGIDVLALLPIPQLLIGVAFHKIWGPGSFRLLNFIISFCLLAQYLPRIYRIRRELKRIKNRGSLAKAISYFSLYLFTSHVFGAFWYFFSIQREISCWHSACGNHNTEPKRCIDAIYCDHKTIASRNITFLNEHCSIDISNGASSVSFNFGIYLDALKTVTVGNVNFLTKFFYCFWWGLRNISNFGTNLMTSTYVWENVFAICISIISFVLLAFVGSTATATAPPQVGVNSLPAPVSEQKQQQQQSLFPLNGVSYPVSEQRRKKILMENLKSWNISGHDLPSDQELSSIYKKVEENEDADLKNDIFSVLPAETRKRLQRLLCMEILRTVPELQGMDTLALERICHYLKPVTYKDNSFIFRMGDPLDCMLFIIKGTVCTYSWTSSTSATSSKMAARLLGEGQFYGEDLLNSPDFTQLPISTEHVKTRGKVQAFALMADDLATVVANNCANNDDTVEIN